MFGSTAALRARVDALEAQLGQLRLEWIQAQGELEELHRRNLNVIRSLRRAASHAEARSEEGEGYDTPQLREADYGELERARRHYGG